MKQIISNYRYWVLFALASVIIIGLIVVPSTDTTFGMYAAVIFGSKAAVLAALLAFCHYYMKWKDEGNISELTDLEEE